MKNAFTLAEVLITLGIIGVVAALTLPSLIAKYQEKVTVTKVKKAYSIISNAYNLALNEYGTPDNWDLIGQQNQQGAVNMREKFLPYLKNAKVCDRTTEQKCGSTLSAMPGGASGVILADGTVLGFLVDNATCNSVRGTGILAKSCGRILVYMNAYKQPDQGFIFYVNKDGIMPIGSQEEATAGSFQTGCLPSADYYSCTAWVVINENMDYLHCNNLSWGGKTKCN